MINLLIADDEFIIRKGLSSINWDSYGIHMLPVASNGSEALQIIQSSKTDILLTDIRMPGINGLDLAMQMLSFYPNSRVIFLTGYAEFEYAHKAISLGAVDYLLKPTRLTDIIDSVLKAKEFLQKQKISEKEASDIHFSQEVYFSTCRPALEYLLNHYYEQITLQSLAEKFHFSPSHLSRSIKKATGFTFIQILTGVRLYHAGIILRNSSLHISEICENIGIPNEQYFSQLFKNNYGVTPNAYRKNQQSTPSAILRWLESYLH